MESLPDLPQEETFGDTTQINFSESPLFLVLNTSPQDKQRDLPIQLYENSLTIVEGKPKSSFKSVSFTIQTSEIERIGVDHMANITRSGASLCMF
jgi:COP9 signalosome complex subunit 6